MTTNANVLKKYMNPFFVETGTSIGDGVALALHSGFNNIYSIELYEEYYKQAVERFKGDNRVRLFKGDCMDVLPTIIPLINGPATFWLDAHVNGKKSPAWGKKGCPILEEIDIIMKNHLFNKTIMIDDMRLFRGLGRNLWGCITDKDILTAFSKYGDFKIGYEDGYKKEDIMVVEIKCQN